MCDQPPATASRSPPRRWRLGPPAERDPALVKEDLRDGFITGEQAAGVYGLPS